MPRHGRTEWKQKQEEEKKKKKTKLQHTMTAAGADAVLFGSSSESTRSNISNVAFDDLLRSGRLSSGVEICIGCRPPPGLCIIVGHILPERRNKLFGRESGGEWILLE